MIRYFPFVNCDVSAGILSCLIIYFRFFFYYFMNFFGSYNCVNIVLKRTYNNIILRYFTL
jgi:hypothetical protein